MYGLRGRAANVIWGTVDDALWRRAITAITAANDHVLLTVKQLVHMLPFLIIVFIGKENGVSRT